MKKQAMYKERDHISCSDVRLASTSFRAPEIKSEYRVRSESVARKVTGPFVLASACPARSAPPDFLFFTGPSSICHSVVSSRRCSEVSFVSVLQARSQQLQNRELEPQWCQA